MRPRRLCAALLLLLGWTAPLPAAQRVEGYGPWRFGMSKAEVQAVEAHGPYTPVASTGGLETKNGPFAGETRNVSFVFNPAGLFHIQVWAYQGTDFEQAAKELHGVYRHLVETFGPVHNDGEPWPADLTLEAFKSRILQQYRQGAAAPGTFIETLQSQGSTNLDMLKLHLHPQQPIEGAEVYGSLIYAPKLPGYWVFLYYKLPKAQGPESRAGAGKSFRPSVSHVPAPVSHFPAPGSQLRPPGSHFSAPGSHFRPSGEVRGSRRTRRG